jgi:hypothetical protein
LLAALVGVSGAACLLFLTVNKYSVMIRNIKLFDSVSSPQTPLFPISRVMYRVALIELHGNNDAMAGKKGKNVAGTNIAIKVISSYVT